MTTTTKKPHPARLARKQARRKAMAGQPSPEQKAKMKEERRKGQIPKPEKYDVELSSGTVKFKFTYGTDTVDRKVHIVLGAPMVIFKGGSPQVWGSTIRKQYARLARDKKGNPIKVPVEVPACFLTVTMPDGTKMSSRSCCKPPDVNRRYEARRFALVHLFEQDKEYKHISFEDREKIMRACVPQLFKKPGDAERAKAMNQVVSAPAGTVMIADEKGVLRKANAEMQEHGKHNLPTTSPMAAKTTAKTSDA